MADFDDHILQAKRNLIFLEEVNSKISDSTDWQVTICFYTALHLVNAHLSKFGLQYRRHTDVKNALNPLSQTSPSKLPEDEYVAYAALQMLSRRSRYLVNEKDGKVGSSKAHLTYDKHLAKAIRHLDTLISFFFSRYRVELPEISIKCSGFRSGNELKAIKLLNNRLVGGRIKPES